MRSVKFDAYQACSRLSLLLLLALTSGCPSTRVVPTGGNPLAVSDALSDELNASCVDGCGIGGTGDLVEPLGEIAASMTLALTKLKAGIGYESPACQFADMTAAQRIGCEQHLDKYLDQYLALAKSGQINFVARATLPQNIFFAVRIDLPAGQPREIYFEPVRTRAALANKETRKIATAYLHELGHMLSEKILDSDPFPGFTGLANPAQLALTKVGEAIYDHEQRYLNYDALVLASQPAAYYMLEDARSIEVAKDSSTFANAAAYFGIPQRQDTGPVDELSTLKSVSFGTRSQYFAGFSGTIPQLDNAQLTATTVTFWMKWRRYSSETTFPYQVLHFDSGTQFGSLSLFLTSQYFGYGMSTNVGPFDAVPNTALSDRWVHIALVLISPANRTRPHGLYIDGVAVSPQRVQGISRSYHSRATFSPNFSMSGLRNYVPGNGTGVFHGNLSRVAFFPYRLTNRQIWNQNILMRQTFDADPPENW